MAQHQGAVFAVNERQLAIDAGDRLSCTGLAAALRRRAPPHNHLPGAL